MFEVNMIMNMMKPSEVSSQPSTLHAMSVLDTCGLIFSITP